jgi:hypothetical protein
MNPSPVCNIVAALLRRNVRNRPRHLKVFTSWPLAVGECLASMAIPHKVVTAGGRRTLVLEATGGHPLEIQHESLKILEKVNDFVGEKDYFLRLKVIQVVQKKSQK